MDVYSVDLGALHPFVGDRAVSTTKGVETDQRPGVG